MSRKDPCQYEPGSKRKRVLYVGSGRKSFESLIDDMAGAPGTRRLASEIYPVLEVQEWVSIDTGEADAAPEGDADPGPAEAADAAPEAPEAPAAEEPATPPRRRRRAAAATTEAPAAEPDPAPEPPPAAPASNRRRRRAAVS